MVVVSIAIIGGPQKKKQKTTQQKSQIQKLQKLKYENNSKTGRRNKKIVLNK